MKNYLLFSAIAFTGLGFFVSATVSPVTTDACAPDLLGGDPRIQLCGRLSGDVFKAEWESTTEVKLVGCLPGAHITSLSLCIRNCEGKAEALTTANGKLTQAMKKMIANLPKGTLFVVRVAVTDDQGRAWQVPDAAFVWKG